MTEQTGERERLRDPEGTWRRWGPYLADRQWGTVREDYSADGDVWHYFPHDHAHRRAYRWGEDGLLGVTDHLGRLALAPAFWNGRDSMLKERLFGLTGPEGNHGEDVKELYHYLDATPSSSYLKALYRYPQAAFPYDALVAENGRRGRDRPEYELMDTGIFDEHRYFDLTIEYAKDGPTDLYMRVTAVNRGPEPAELWVVPTLWFRNTWRWQWEEASGPPPHLARDGARRIVAVHPHLGVYHLLVDDGPAGPPELLFTENETNNAALYGVPNATPYVKDAFHRYLIHGETGAVNPAEQGTKAAAVYRLALAPGETVPIRVRLVEERFAPRRTVGGMGAAADAVLATRRVEADAYHAALTPAGTTPDEAAILRQARAGLLWSQKFYHLDMPRWMSGDAGQPAPPPERRRGRNADWCHLNNRDILSMPDGWEYPWYAAWDLAFHMLPLARLDPEAAKAQLILLLREWYMHPNGQIPAYEFAFGDVNPPVHAWACWRVYKMTGPRGGRDRLFLERVFQKLLINFTWWVNRKDLDGNHLFTGGFLGLDNIGVFDRSQPLPSGGHLEQADGTAWMAFYCGTMLAIALELARENPAYEDVATKFFEHFLAIADAMNTFCGTGLWDETDGFYYDQLHNGAARTVLRIRSMVGLIPLFACEILEAETLERLPDFRSRLRWFLTYRSRLLGKQITFCDPAPDGSGDLLLALPTCERLRRVLRYVLDPEEFLSPFGVRSLSRVHRDRPFLLTLDGTTHRVAYEPGESASGLFGGNSNWRGPVWFPLNFLLIEALERYDHFYGAALQVEFPHGSGRQATLGEVAQSLAQRLGALFVPDADGRRPCHGSEDRYRAGGPWQNEILFHEYFHGDDGRGLGASHQTGWTALVAPLLEGIIRRRR